MFSEDTLDLINLDLDIMMWEEPPEEPPEEPSPIFRRGITLRLGSRF